MFPGLHKLAKEADWVAEVGPSNGEVDKASDYLSIVTRVTLVVAGVGI